MSWKKGSKMPKVMGRVTGLTKQPKKLTSVQVASAGRRKPRPCALPPHPGLVLWFSPPSTEFLCPGFERSDAARAVTPQWSPGTLAGLRSTAPCCRCSLFEAPLLQSQGCDCVLGGREAEKHARLGRRLPRRAARCQLAAPGRPAGLASSECYGDPRPRHGPRGRQRERG